ncbi:MAG: hypothetical protein ABI770_05725 [Sphingomicrobium sp.]
MVIRKWVGDIGLAVLLALPTAALTRPAAHADNHHNGASAATVLVASVGRPTEQQRFNLPR